MSHYTDGRRWSEISKAWIFETSWNDREEIASLRAQLATVTAERDAARELNRINGEALTELTHAANQAEAERDEYRSCNEHHKAQFLATNLELSRMRAERDALKSELAQAQKDRDSWHAIVIDNCEEDEQFRKVAGEWDKSDSYGVEYHSQILERVLQALAQAITERDRWRNYSWTEAVQFLADAKENLTQQYCNLQILYGEQKHKIRDLEKELAQAREQLIKYAEVDRIATEKDCRVRLLRKELAEARHERDMQERDHHWWKDLSHLAKKEKIELQQQLHTAQAALRAILGWRELRSGANEIPIKRIEELCEQALKETGA